MAAPVYYFKRETLTLNPLRNFVAWFKPIALDAKTEPIEKTSILRFQRWPVIVVIVLSVTFAANIVQRENGAGTVQQWLKPAPWNAFLFALRYLGIDTLHEDLFSGLVALLTSLVLLGMVEACFLAHAQVLFFLLVNTMFSLGQWSFLLFFCRGIAISTLDMLERSCCSSFLLMSSIGLFLVLWWRSLTSQFVYRTVLGCFIVVMWILICLNDYYYHFDGEPDHFCSSVTWHGMSYLFGLVCGLVLG